MRTTTILWPEATLGCPLRNGYGANIPPMFERTTIEELPPGFKLLRFDERRDYRAEFLWTLAQLAEFETFYQTTINYGLRAFMMKALTTGIMEPLYTQMVSAYSVTPQPDHTGLYRVAFQATAFWRVAEAVNWE